MNRRPVFQSRRLAVSAAALTVLACASANAFAGIQGCDPSAGQGRDKVIIASLDELANSIGERAVRAIKASIEMRFDRAGAQLKEEAEIIYCKRRRMLPSDAYRRDVTSVLNDEQVLLEIGARRTGSEITVTYVVVPVRLYEHFLGGNQNARGYHEALYDKRRIARDLKGLFESNPDVRLMAALALAQRYEKLGDGEPDNARKRAHHNRSRAYFCDAVGSIEAARPGANYLGLEQGDWEALGALAQRGAERLFEKLTSTGSVASALAVVASERANAGTPEAACVTASNGPGDATRGGQP